MKKSQAFSIDIMLAMVIFLGAIFVTYSVLQGGKGGKTKDLEKDASLVLDNLASQNNRVGIVNGIEINQTKLGELLVATYPELKEKIRARSDFCIYLEDENGDVIYLSDSQQGIGSDKISISDQPCG